MNNTTEEDTIKVVYKKGAHHTIKNDEVTHCGLEYDEDETEERNISWAGMWCIDCVGIRYGV